MSALGGRLGAYRSALPEGSLKESVARNVFHEAVPSDAALAFVAGGLERLAAALDAASTAELLEGRLP